MSIADMVRETVNDYLREKYLPGFSFNEEYQLYYNSDTGYYFDQNLSLYYHPQTKCYYYYDEDSESLAFHSRVPAVHRWTNAKMKAHATSLFGDLFVRGMPQDEVDVCECLFALVATTAGMVDGETTGSDDESDQEIDDQDHDDERELMIEEERLCFAPCVRIITPSGALHVVTIDGGTVGSAPSCDIFLRSDNPSSSLQCFAKIEYTEVDKQYSIVCMDESSDVTVNEEKLCSGERRPVEHLDRWTVRGHHFIAHIHHGSNTCAGCEPGLSASVEAAAVTTSECRTKISVEAARRRALRMLKDQYGLLNDDSEVWRSAEFASTYTDRAQQRRHLMAVTPVDSDKYSSVGADPMYANCEAKPVPGASHESAQLRDAPMAVDVSLDSTNKGYALLRNMGWKEGTGLGKKSSGITEPIVAEARTSRAGLGAPSANAPPVPPSRKMRILDVTRSRYEHAHILPG